MKSISDTEIRNVNSDQVYFPNLNGVRAIAAFMVIVFHIELIKREFSFKNIVDNLNTSGDLGVVLFFVLSGFLITFLLLTEQAKTGDISLKNFYARRILRIWPLYLIIVLSCLFVLPHVSFLYEPLYSTTYIQNKIIIIFLYLFFMSNILSGFDSHVNFARPTWSVSVEEQFYLLWPVLMKFSKNKKRTIIGVIIIYWTIRLGLLFIEADPFWVLKPSVKHNVSIMSSIWFYTPFDSLSVGALAALTLFTKSNFLKTIYTVRAQKLIFIAIPVLIYIFSLRTTFLIQNISVEFTNEVYSILFAFVILNLAGNSNTIISFENRFLKYLGKISYGLYLYHWIIIVFVINCLKRFSSALSQNTLLFNLVLYSLSIVLTILLAGISYFLIEYRFLKFKHRYSKITSGDFVKD